LVDRRGTHPEFAMRVLITGGTGRLAGHILARHGASGIAWRILSRRPYTGTHDWAVGDLVTGAGLPAAVEGVDAILHLASDPTRPEQDVCGTKRLAGAAAASGVRHLLFLSIIGVDRIPLPYYRAKLEAEAAVMRGGVPWTVLRAAQFHSFIDWLFRRTLRVPGLMIVPAGFKIQSVADEDMADRLVAALQTGPAGRTRDYAGPEILRVSEAARVWRSARGLRRAILPAPVPGQIAGAFRRGGNTTVYSDQGHETWASWLRRQYPSAT
jgi:uncharacterized protein YbjT (DUF2867 family)